MSKPERILFMAQLPPPYHGQSVISGTVHDIFKDDIKAEITHLWKGGAKTATDVGKRSLSKYLEFASMVLILLGYLIRFKRFEIAYMGVAPWAHTITRDTILMFLAKLLSKRVWIHIHGVGLDKFTSPQSAKEKLVSAAFKSVEIISLTQADFKHTKESGHFSQVHLVPNFAIDPGTHAIPTRKTLHIGTIGNLDPRKGVFDFVETMAVLNKQGVDVRGTIMGGPTAELSVEAMEAYVADKGLAKLINVTGRVSDEKKHDVFTDMDIFLYPSRHDLAPLSLIEAIAHGCVPVVFETGGIPEIVGPDFAKHVFPTGMEQAEFAEAASAVISIYAGDKKALKADAKRVRAHFLATYSVANFKLNILNIIAQGNELQSDEFTSNPPSSEVMS